MNTTPLDAEAPESYAENEVNSYGDVEVVKRGWIEVALSQARGATPKYYRIIRWEGS